MSTIDLNHMCLTDPRESVSQSNRHQQGFTLISVLIILLIITILGVIAMRQGLTTLNISTNAQVRELLTQSTDTVLNNYSLMDMTADGAVSVATVIGSALDPSSLGYERVFCYRPMSNQLFGSTFNSNLIHANPTGDSSIVDDSGGKGFCDLKKDFGSGRNAAITQVAVTQPTEESTGRAGDALAPDTNVSEGGGLPKGLVTQQRVRVIATSILPSMGSSLDVVQSDCLQGRISDNSDPANANKETVTDCLARYNVPANTQVQEYNLGSGLKQTANID